MIPMDRFERALQVAMQGRPLDPQQLAAVNQPTDKPLVIVAGPGTGKTTTIVARALKEVFVDGWDPKTIMFTTFTRKAAAEMRSRLLGWGIGVKEFLQQDSSVHTELDYLESIDINRIRTGTLDSLAQEILAEYRPVNTSTPLVLDEFISNGILLRNGLFEGNLWRNQDFMTFALAHGLRNTGRGPSVRDMLRLARLYADRTLHDLLNLPHFASQSEGHRVMAQVITQYHQSLDDFGTGLADYATLEHQFYNQLRSGQLEHFVSNLRSLFVDEYQDTNALQEAIYMEIGQRIGNCITVVGDDDQSLYRFRGGTVELFSQIEERFREALQINSLDILYLNTNYRSTISLMNFVNDFAELDEEYQPSRIPNKPRLIYPNHTTTSQSDSDTPVLALFRPDIEALSDDLGKMMDGLFNRRQLSLATDHGNLSVVLPPAGRPGDCAYLGFSVRERKAWNPFGRGGAPRLPLLLRWSLGNLERPIKVFNPRGQPLEEVPEVQRLCGLMLECIDPDSYFQDTIQNWSEQALQTLTRWREVARDFIRQDPAPSANTNLRDFVTAWANRTSQTRLNWPNDIPLLDLCYQLSTWLPSLHDDPEKQVFLEVIARAISKSASMNTFSSRFVSASESLERSSVLEAIRQIFTPIAMGDISIDEDLLETFPRDAVNVLTIHQAKGLEFPMTIVDVASDFKINARTQRFMRFPDQKDETHIIEDHTIPHSRLREGSFRSWRDRAFDDLVRRYFVAFSRAQTLMVLVGLDASRPERAIRNVALGSARNGVSHWRETGKPYAEILQVGTSSRT